MLDFRKFAIVKIVSCVIIITFMFNDIGFSMSLRNPVGKIDSNRFLAATSQAYSKNTIKDILAKQDNHKSEYIDTLKNLLPEAQKLLNFLGKTKLYEDRVEAKDISKDDLGKISPIILALGSPSPEAFKNAALDWVRYKELGFGEVPVIASTGRGRGYKNFVKMTLEFFEKEDALDGTDFVKQFRQRYGSEIKKAETIDADALYKEYNTPPKIAGTVDENTLTEAKVIAFIMEMYGVPENVIKLEEVSNNTQANVIESEKIINTISKQKPFKIQVVAASFHRLRALLTVIANIKMPKGSWEVFAKDSEDAQLENMSEDTFYNYVMQTIGNPSKAEEVSEIERIEKYHLKDLSETVKNNIDDYWGLAVERLRNTLFRNYQSHYGKRDKLKGIFEQAIQELKDNKNPQAMLLLNKAMSFYYTEIADEEILKEDPVVIKLNSDIKAYISKIENKDFGLRQRLVQAVDNGSGISLGEEVDFVTAHKTGVWHANSQVVVMDQKGRILVQKRLDNYNKLDLSATGHLYKGEDYISAAIRIIKSEIGLSAVREKSLQELKGIKGSKKIGRQDYTGKPYYDEENDIFYFSSKEIDNREYGKFFLYVLSQAELNEIEKSGNPLIQFHELSDFVDSIKNFRNDEFASAAINLFCHDYNINLVYSEALKRSRTIIKSIADNPKDMPEIGYLEDVYGSAQKIIDKLDDWKGTDWAVGLDAKDSDFADRSRGVAFNEFKAVYEEAKVVAIWHKLVEYYRGKEILGWKELHNVLGLIKLFGNEADTVYGRALLNTFLTKGVILQKLSDGRFVFKYENRQLSGVSINKDGLLTISKKVKEGINVIRRGAIAADMDLTTAVHRENIDHEMLSYINQFLMIGLEYAVVSGNEFTLQYNRSLTQLISPLLIQNFIMYANGAGIKVRFNKQGEIKQDDVYIKRMKDNQLKELDRILNLAISDWNNVLRIIKESNVDIAKLTEDDIKKIESGIQGLALLLDKEGDIQKNIGKILKEMQETPNKDKRPLDIDTRKDIHEKDIIQVTLKPVIPKRARKVLAAIIEKEIGKFEDNNPPPSPSERIKITEGGSTSIDCTRKDVNKATAAEDLIKEQKLSGEDRELILAIDDEMAPEKVGFPFLTVPGITVISNEKTIDGEKRDYSGQDKDVIRANWFWSGENDLGYQVDATKKVYSLLGKLYMEEVLRLCAGQEIQPAIKKLKDFLGFFEEKNRIDLETYKKSGRNFL